MPAGRERLQPLGSGRLDLIHNPYQEAFLDALSQRLSDNRRTYSRLALFSGRRGGKTKIGGLGSVLEARRPNSRIWVCAPTYPKLADYVIPAVDEALPQAWLAEPYSKGRYEWRLVNGSLVQARSLDDIGRGRGPGLDLLWIDEARDVSPIAWETLMPALTDRGGAAIITTSPNGFDWTYKHFWAPAQDGTRGFWACKYRSLDNPVLDRDEVELARATMDPLFFQQEFEAEFVSFTGAVYADTLPAQILEGDDQIRRIIPEWPKVNPSRETMFALDPGSDHPFAGVLFVATEQGLVAIGEYLERNRPTVHHAAALRGLCARDNPQYPFQPGLWPIDRSQKQMQIELAQHGIYTTAAENDVMAGIQRVQSWLVSKRLWFIRKRTPKTIEQLYSYRYADNYDAKGESRRERVVKRDDDLPDCVRYGMMAWPELPLPPESSPFRDVSAMPEKMQQDLQRQQRLDHPNWFEDEDVDTPGMLSETGTGDFWG